MWVSSVTSQWMYVAVDGPKELQSDWPKSSWMSAIMSLAPWWAKSFAVHSPMPLAPPVMRATFPCSLVNGERGYKMEL